MKRRNQFRLPPGAASEPLTAFLARRFTYLSAAEWEALAERGSVTVNGLPCAPGDLVGPGDLLETELGDRAEPPVDDRVGVVFEDGDLLVLDKSGNLPCHPGGAYFNHTLWALLRARFRVPEPVLVNRLDRETSGLVLVAKSPEAGKRARAEFAGRRAAKLYRALVEGMFPEERRACGGMVGDEGGPVRKRRRFVEGVSPAEAGGEWADTAFRRLSYGNGVSLVEAAPATGRLHQIRATLLALGFPVVGDKLYGPDPEMFLRFCQGGLTPEDRVRLRLDRQALHAFRLRLRHPRTGRMMEWEAPMPADFAPFAQGG